MENNRSNGVLRKVNFGFLLFAVVIAYFLFLIRNDIVGSGKLNAESKAVSDQIKEQGILRKDLYGKLKLLDQNDYIEKLAREKLGLIRQGEKAYKVVNPK
ncbi:septum formation initiator family protein [Candidatus Margulisiibacteriota bacterium]